MCIIIIQSNKVTVSKIVNGTNYKKSFFGLSPMEAKKKFINEFFCS